MPIVGQATFVISIAIDSERALDHDRKGTACATATAS